MVEKTNRFMCYPFRVRFSIHYQLSGSPGSPGPLAFPAADSSQTEPGGNASEALGVPREAQAHHGRHRGDYNVRPPVDVM
jgi:hypothetical protein